LDQGASPVLFKGTIAMVCIAGLLLAWIGLVAWARQGYIAKYQLDMALVKYDGD
jgi:hypothetical protein